MLFVSFDGVPSDKTMHLDIDPALSLSEAKRIIGFTLNLQPEDFYLIYNGKALTDVSEINDDDGLPVKVVLRTFGGKGGFGSMLRAIGAQIEKTTNQDACRDLSGRRLRDTQEIERLRRWFAKQKQREEEREELKKKKLEKLRQICEGPPLPKMEDKEYNRVRAEMSDAVYEAVEKGFAVLSSSKSAAACASASACTSTGSSDEADSSSSHGEGSKPSTKIQNNEGKREVQKLKRTMLDEDLDSDVSSSDSEEDEQPSAKKQRKTM